MKTALIRDMANYPRGLIVYDGSVFHVTWKCHNEDWLLSSEFAKRLYYELLVKYKDLYGIQIFSYCFMDNHPHLTGQCETQEKFSDFFRVVNSCFARKLNRYLKRKGQAVMDRFKSPVMETDEDLMSVIIYNDLNPFRTIKRIHPRDFKWSSYHQYAYGKSDPLLTEPECYKEMGKTPKERQRNYRFMIDEILKNDHRLPKCPYRDKGSPLCYVGNPEWVKERHSKLREVVYQKRKEWEDRHREFLGL